MREYNLMMWRSREQIAEGGGMKGRLEIGAAAVDSFFKKLGCEAKEKPGRIEHLGTEHVCVRP